MISEGLTKTRAGGLGVKPRLATPQMFVNGEKRCPVVLFKQYLNKRPAELKTTGPLYLGVIDKPQTSAWYKTPMGKNTIKKKKNIMKTMKENSPLKDFCPDKKLTNHSARKTVVKKLKSSGIPKCEIQNITGHSSEQGLDDYDSGDENEQRVMSNIIDNATIMTTCATPTARQVLQPLSSVQTQASAAPGQVYNFSHCNVTLNIAGSHSSQPSLSQSKRG